MAPLTAVKDKCRDQCGGTRPNGRFAGDWVSFEVPSGARDILQSGARFRMCQGRPGSAHSQSSGLPEAEKPQRNVLTLTCGDSIRSSNAGLILKAPDRTHLLWGDAMGTCTGGRTCRCWMTADGGAVVGRSISTRRQREHQRL